MAAREVQAGRTRRFNEVHIDDPDFYNEVYTKHTAARPIDRLEKYKHRFGRPEALVSTVDGETHRIRRAAVAPFFSNTRISTLGDTPQEVIENTSHGLSTEYAGTGKVINLAFARRTRFSDAPEFQSPYTQAMMSWVFASHLTTHFNFMIQTMHWMSDASVGRLLPSLKPLLDYRQVRDVLAGKNMDAKDASHATIFHDILRSDLPPKELTELRLTQEAMSVSGAGVETTMWTLSVITFHVLWNPAIDPDCTRRVRSRPVAAQPARPDGKHPLASYLVSFTRGSRVCIGQHLVMMDMYVALATLFRRHKLQLFETDRSDEDFQVDLVRPMPKWESKGVIIIVKDQRL
ncbi:cytochrome P450 [Whalleya microplaca]|nr:cytochrome P450 [Whalleya microplaca]